MNRSQSIDEILHSIYNDGWCNGDLGNRASTTYEELSILSAKAAIEAMVREIIGEDSRYATDTVMQRFAEAITAGHLTEVDYKNQLRKEQRLRASKYNLKLEKE